MTVTILQAATHRSRAHQSGFVRWLTHLGPLGLLMIAVLDSSIIPMPVPGSTDLVLLWLVSHRGNPLFLVPITIAGSLAGGYTTWHLGRKGGEAALKRYVPERMFARITGWAERHPGLAVFVPAILPPPIPLSPFLLAAGALNVSVRRFLLVFAMARALRYSLVAWLAVVYGRKVMRLWSSTLAKWSAPIGWTFAALTVAGILYGIWKLRRPASREEREPAFAGSPAEAE